MLEQEKIEAEEIRQQDLQSRYNNLYDKRMACFGICNPDAYFRDSIIKNSNHSEAEQRMKEIEVADINFKKESFINKEQQKLIDLRATRDKYLNATDRTQIADYPLDGEGKTKYRVYRAYLRDLPLAIAEARIVDYKVKTFEEFNG